MPSRKFTLVPARLRYCLVALCLSLGALFLAACGQGQASRQPAANPQPAPQTGQSAKYASPQALYEDLAKLPQEERQRRLVEGAKAEEGKAFWYTVLDEDAVEILKKAIAQKYPFIKLEYLSGKATDLNERIMAEMRSGKFLADLIGTGPQIEMFQKEFPFAKHYGIPVNADIPKQYYGDYWITHAVVPNVIAWNNKMVKPGDAPTGYQDLLNPKWKGQISIDIDPVHTMVAMMEKWGPDQTRDYFSKLVQGNDAIINKGHTKATQSVIVGEFPLALELFLYGVESQRAKGAPIDWLAPDPTPAITWPTGVTSKAQHPYTAMLVMQELVTAEFGREVAKLGYIPVNKKADVAFERLRYFNTPEAQAKLRPNTPELTAKYFKEADRIAQEIIYKKIGLK